MNIYQDADGCLFDWDQQLYNFFGKTPSDFQSDDVMWEKVKERADDFWLTMPLKFGAKQLWDCIIDQTGEAPTILTGCPKNHYEIASAHKITKAKMHFGDNIKIITCLSRNKPLHMNSPGDILIDDMSRNIRRWEKAGGRGVHYRNLYQTMDDFKALMKSLKDEESN